LSDRPSFDLTREPWIPCERADGTRVELSLRDVLLQAHELRAVHDGSPLVTAALHRILIAIAHRAVDGPKDEAAWRALWQARRFDPGSVDAYLVKWRHRFDVFDEKRPFMQSTGMTAKPLQAIRLRTECSPYGSPVEIFAHRADDAPTDLSPAEAARAMLGVFLFHRGGIVSGPMGGRAYVKGGPLATAAMVLLVGDTVFETVVLNVLVYDGCARPFAAKADLPEWERDSPRPPRPSTPAGWLDLLTWPSRSVFLSAARGRVVTAQLAGGLDIDTPSLLDPMAAYTKSDEGWRAFKLDPDRVAWRDSAALFRLRDDATTPPAAIRAMAGRVRDGVVDAAVATRIAVLGQALEDASVELTRAEYMPLPAAVLRDDAAGEWIAEALNRDAEGAHGALRFALRRLVEQVLSPMYDPGSKQKGRKPLADDVTKLVRRTGAHAVFWASMKPAFDALLVGLGTDPKLALVQWQANLRRAARAAYTRAADSFGETARVHKGAALGRSKLEYELGVALPSEVTDQGAIA
jgi:CRISPR system Cascade subunit CasA